MKAVTDSFAVAPVRDAPYIEPSFTKNEFNVEKPQVLLISAVGATGKSTLAQALSSRLNLPLLSLGRHKPVGDNTLTGLLTTSFPVDQLSAIFQSIGSGEFGIIIDGIDEGRSKTTEQAFQAFLDDIARLCTGAASPSFVLLGRTQILEECWIYLEDKGISTGLLTIDPFSLDQARSYIDNFTNGLKSPQASQYSETRDLILNKLSSAFSAADAAPEGNFLSFIGYPPVLDAIVTLLDTEQNYHRLKEQLAHSASQNIEIELLLKIADYILARERDEKVVPNIVEDLLPGLVPPIEPTTRSGPGRRHDAPDGRAPRSRENHPGRRARRGVPGPAAYPRSRDDPAVRRFDGRRQALRARRAAHFGCPAGAAAGDQRGVRLRALGPR